MKPTIKKTLTEKPTHPDLTGVQRPTMSKKFSELLTQWGKKRITDLKLNDMKKDIMDIISQDDSALSPQKKKQVEGILDTKKNVYALLSYVSNSMLKGAGLSMAALESVESIKRQIISEHIKREVKRQLNEASDNKQSYKDYYKKNTPLSFSIKNMPVNKITEPILNKIDELITSGKELTDSTILKILTPEEKKYLKKIK